MMKGILPFSLIPRELATPVAHDNVWPLLGCRADINRVKRILKSRQRSEYKENSS